MTDTPEDLGRKIKDAQAREKREDAVQTAKMASGNANSGAATALRAATELVAALAVGGFIGYGLDRWLGTRPWFMIALLFLGFGAGFLNIYRAQMGQDFKIGFKDDKKE